MADNTPVALASGGLAYLDSHEGLVPVKVESVGRVNGWPKVTVRVTADRQAYRRGDTVAWPPRNVAPRASVRTRNRQPIVVSNWHVVSDSGERIDVFA